MTLGVPYGYSSERVMLALAGIQKAVFERPICARFSPQPPALRVHSGLERHGWLIFLWHRLLGGPCLSLADYVRVAGTRDGATAAGGPFMLPSLPGHPVCRIDQLQSCRFNSYMMRP